MATVSKEQILQSVEKLPQDMLEEAWLFLEFLNFKASSTKRQKDTSPQKLEGMFPELDISFDDIENALHSDWLDRQSRLSPDA